MNKEKRKKENVNLFSRFKFKFHWPVCLTCDLIGVNQIRLFVKGFYIFI